MDKFAGIWIWTSGADTLRILLKKENIQFPGDNYRIDKIVGFHSYKKVSGIVESSLQFQQTNYNDGKSTILTGSDRDNNFILVGSFIDLSMDKLVDLKLTMNSAQNRLTLVLREIPGIRYGSLVNYNKFSIPNNIILKRFIPISDVE